jgi:hypothetical protein
MVRSPNRINLRHAIRGYRIQERLFHQSNNCTEPNSPCPQRRGWRGRRCARTSGVPESQRCWLMNRLTWASAVWSSARPFSHIAIYRIAVPAEFIRPIPRLQVLSTLQEVPAQVDGYPTAKCLHVHTRCRPYGDRPPGSPLPFQTKLEFKSDHLNGAHFKCI